MRHIPKNLFLVFAFLLIPAFSRADTDCAVTIYPIQEYEKCPDCVNAEVVVENTGDAGWFHIWIWAQDGSFLPCLDEEFCVYLEQDGVPGDSITFNFDGREWCEDPPPKCAPTGNLDIYVEVRYCGLANPTCTYCEEEILCIGACSDF
jgi:hypothetical protein